MRQLNHKSWIRKIVLLLFCMSGGYSLLLAQSVSDRRLYTTEADSLLFVRYLSRMEGIRHRPMSELLMVTARFFLETPYVAATLEREPEGLVVNLREMDCTTFVENVLALSRTLQTETPSFRGFCDQLQAIRYREGQIKDYTDRLHYTSDWIYENARRGVVEDVTEAAGGVPLRLDLSFMSTHSAAYKQLDGNKLRIGKIASLEREISTRSYFYIPQDSIESCSSQFRDGDVVCFVTSIPGLDIAHVGIICRVGEKLTFIHASSTGKKVIVNETALSDYVKGVKRDIGILVVRPLPYFSSNISM